MKPDILNKPERFSLIEWSLLPVAVLDRKNDDLTKSWVEKENELCNGLVYRVSLIAGILMLLLPYTDFLRFNYEPAFIWSNRAVCSIAFLLVALIIRFGIGSSRKYPFALYKSSFLLSSLIMSQVQNNIMIVNPAVPYYGGLVLPIAIYVCQVGTKSTILYSLLHTSLLIFSLLSMTDTSGMISAFSYQIFGIVIALAFSTKYHLDADLFVAKYTEQQRKEEWGAHGYAQLNKFLYSHQISAIQSRTELEKTMPVGRTNCFSIAFDTVASSKIKHINFQKTLEAYLVACNEIMRENYCVERLESNAFSVKEMYDGFLCSVGFPFHPPQGKPVADLTFEIALRFIDVFDSYMSKLDTVNPITCAIGIAYGEIEGYFTRGFPTRYEARGRSLVIATRIESLRKAPRIAKLCESHTHHLIIATEYLISSLDPKTRKDFIEISLDDFETKVRDAPEENQVYLYPDIK